MKKQIKTYLQSQNKIDLIKLAEKIGIPNTQNLTKSEIIELMELKEKEVKKILFPSFFQRISKNLIALLTFLATLFLSFVISYFFWIKSDHPDLTKKTEIPILVLCNKTTGEIECFPRFIQKTEDSSLQESLNNHPTLVNNLNQLSLFENGDESKIEQIKFISNVLEYAYWHRYVNSPLEYNYLSYSHYKGLFVPLKTYTRNYIDDSFREIRIVSRDNSILDSLPVNINAPNDSYVKSGPNPNSVLIFTPNGRLWVRFNMLGVSFNLENTDLSLNLLEKYNFPTSDSYIIAEYILEISYLSQPKLFSDSNKQDELDWINRVTTLSSLFLKNEDLNKVLENDANHVNTQFEKYD